MIRYLFISQVKRRSAPETRAEGEFQGEEGTMWNGSRPGPRGGMPFR